MSMLDPAPSTGKKSKSNQNKIKIIGAIAALGFVLYLAYAWKKGMMPFSAAMKTSVCNMQKKGSTWDPSTGKCTVPQASTPPSSGGPNPPPVPGINFPLGSGTSLNTAVQQPGGGTGALPFTGDQGIQDPFSLQKPDPTILQTFQQGLYKQMFLPYDKYPYLYGQNYRQAIVSPSDLTNVANNPYAVTFGYKPPIQGGDIPPNTGASSSPIMQQQYSNNLYNSYGMYGPGGGPMMDDSTYLPQPGTPFGSNNPQPTYGLGAVARAGDVAKAYDANLDNLLQGSNAQNILNDIQNNPNSWWQQYVPQNARQYLNNNQVSVAETNQPAQSQIQIPNVSGVMSNVGGLVSGILGSIFGTPQRREDDDDEHRHEHQDVDVVNQTSFPDWSLYEGYNPYFQPAQFPTQQSLQQQYDMFNNPWAPTNGGQDPFQFGSYGGYGGMQQPGQGQGAPWLQTCPPGYRYSHCGCKCKPMNIMDCNAYQRCPGDPGVSGYGYGNNNPELTNIATAIESGGGKNCNPSACQSQYNGNCQLQCTDPSSAACTSCIGTCCANSFTGVGTFSLFGARAHANYHRKAKYDHHMISKYHRDQAHTDGPFGMNHMPVHERMQHYKMAKMHAEEYRKHRKHELYAAHEQSRNHYKQKHIARETERIFNPDSEYDHPTPAHIARRHSVVKHICRS